MVIMYVGYPLSLRNVEDLLAERGIRHQLRDRPVLVEPVWSDVRRRDPQRSGSRACAAILSGAGMWMRCL